MQGRLHRHTKLWAFYADVQVRRWCPSDMVVSPFSPAGGLPCPRHCPIAKESLGTFAETKQTYESMIDLRIITPQLVLNFGARLSLAWLLPAAMAVCA